MIAIHLSVDSITKESYPSPASIPTYFYVLDRLFIKTKL